MQVVYNTQCEALQLDIRAMHTAVCDGSRTHNRGVVGLQDERVGGSMYHQHGTMVILVSKERACFTFVKRARRGASSFFFFSQMGTCVGLRC